MHVTNNFYLCDNLCITDISSFEEMKKNCLIGILVSELQCYENEGRIKFIN